MIVLAPRSFAACRMNRPMVPAPMTTTVSLLAIGGRLAACVPMEAGSSSEACTNDMFSGSLAQIQWGTARNSAKAPFRLNSGTETPSTCRFTQRLNRPCLQAGH